MSAQSTIQKTANKAGVGSMVQPIIMLILAVIVSLMSLCFNGLISINSLCNYVEDNKTIAKGAYHLGAIPIDIVEMCEDFESSNISTIIPTSDSTRQYRETYEGRGKTDPSSEDYSQPTRSEFDGQRCAGGVTITRPELLEMGFKEVKSGVTVYADLTAAESFKALINKWNTEVFPRLWEADNRGQTFDLKKHKNEIVLTSFSREGSKSHGAGISFDFRNPDYNKPLTAAEISTCRPIKSDAGGRQGVYRKSPACQAMIDKWKNEIDTYQDHFRVLAEREGWFWGGHLTEGGGTQLYYDPVHLDLTISPSMRSCGGNSTNRKTVLRACETSLKCG